MSTTHLFSPNLIRGHVSLDTNHTVYLMTCFCCRWWCLSARAQLNLQKTF